MNKLAFILMIGLVSGCATNKVKQLDTEIDVKGTTSQGVVGLKDDVPVIQEKRPADEELRVQQWKNYQLENDLNHEFHMVDWCYSDLADPRLGGDGETADFPEMKNLKNPVAIKEELGLEGEKLVVVKTSSFPEQLKVERDYEQAMRTMMKEVKKTRSSCERKMGVARVKAGLPSKRGQGVIKISPKGTVESIVKEHESSLDDAFKAKGTEAPQIPKEAEVAPSVEDERTPANKEENTELQPKE
jgi:hypothetical protein